MKRYQVLLIVAVGLFCFCSCAGTHGKIKSYEINSSKNEVKKAMIKIAEGMDNITFYDNTDDSGIKRKGYIDIKIETDKLNRNYKIHFYGGEKFWEENPNFCIFSIIKINGSTDKQFGIWSKDKRISIELFENEFLPKLENMLGKVEPKN